MLTSLNVNFPTHNIAVVLIILHNATIPVLSESQCPGSCLRNGTRSLSFKRSLSPITTNTSYIVLLIMKLEVLHSLLVEESFKLHQNM